MDPFLTGLLGSAATESIQDFIDRHCIIREDGSGSLCSRSGHTYSWIFDFRPLLPNGRMLGLVANIFWDVMGGLWPFQVAGLEMTAIPLVAGIVLEGERRGFSAQGLIVRRKRKKYGRQRIVEGELNPQVPVVLVDDCVNSAQSINTTLLAISNEGLTACAAFAIARFNSRAASEWCIRNKLRINYLFSPSDFGLHSPKETKYSANYTVVWTFASPRPNYRFAVAKSEPVAYRDFLLFGSDSGVFWCVNKKTGEVKWSRDASVKSRKGIISSPVVADGLVYFGGYNGKLYCLDASDGHEVWSQRASDWIGSSPCYAGGYIYIGLEYNSPYTAGALGKFCASSGQREWEVPARQMLHGSPVYSDKHSAILVGTNDSTVLVIDAIGGKVLQLLRVGGPVKYHCGLMGDLAVFGSFDGKIYVWDFMEDRIKLEIQTEDIVYSRPLICDGRAFVGCADHTLRVVDLVTLRELGKIDAGEKIHASPTLVGQTIFVGTSGGMLFGIDRTSLEVTHRWQFPERLTNGVVYDDGLLYVYTYDNKLWAIELRS